MSKETGIVDYEDLLFYQDEELEKCWPECEDEPLTEEELWWLLGQYEPKIEDTRDDVVDWNPYLE